MRAARSDSAHVESRRLLGIAAAHSPSAQVELGTMHFVDGRPTDLVEARRLYGLAAAQGHPDALSFLGSMHWHGEGGPVDFAEARRLLELATAQGHADAQNKLDELDRLKQAASMPLPDSIIPAVKKGDIRTVAAFLSGGGHVNARCGQGKWKNTTMLYNAAGQGNTALVRMLLQRSADPDLKGDDGSTALYQASRQHLETVNLLLGAGASVNLAESAAGETPLHCAASADHLELVRTLLQASAIVDSKDVQGNTPLIMAVADGASLVLLRALLDASADMHCQAYDAGASTALDIAARSSGRRQKEAWAYLKKLEGAATSAAAEFASECADNWLPHGNAADKIVILEARFNAISPFQRAHALLTAAERGNLSGVKRLLSLGVPVEAKEARSGSPLHRASKHSHVQVVEALLSAGADVHASSPTGTSALSVAVDQSPVSVDVVRLLLAARSNPDSMDYKGNTPMLTVVHGPIEPQMLATVIGQLLDAGANINLGWKSGGGSPLQVACSLGRLETANLLVNRKADLNQAAPLTALQSACLKGEIQCVTLLLSLKADATLAVGTEHREFHRHLDGMTPLGISCLHGHLECVRLLVSTFPALLDAMACSNYSLLYNPGMSNDPGLGASPPLSIACCRRNIDVVRCLLSAKVRPLL